MSHIVFLIPSLSRERVLVSKTLALLQEYQVPPEDIHVFVIEEQLASYQQVLPPTIQLHTGPVGLHHMRNHIHKFFPPGTRMVWLDDDITRLCKMTIDQTVPDLRSSKRFPLSPLTKEEFWAFIEDAFRDLTSHSLHLFGIYPVKNGFFMKDLPAKTTDLRFIVGCFWGCINPDPPLVLSIEEKEDFERTLILYERDLGVLRYNHIAPVTSYYKEKGGMQSRQQDRKETGKQSCQYLLEKYPQYCRLYTSKKNGMFEVRLRG